MHEATSDNSQPSIACIDATVWMSANESDVDQAHMAGNGEMQVACQQELNNE